MVAKGGAEMKGGGPRIKAPTILCFQKQIFPGRKKTFFFSNFLQKGGGKLLNWNFF